MVSFKVITPILLLASTTKIHAFATPPMASITAAHRPMNSVLWASISPDVDDEDIEKEYARVRRGGRGRAEYDDDDNHGYERNKGVYSNDVADYYDDGDETFYMDDDDEEYDGDYEALDEDEYGFFGNAIIPNPILDSIDPDGAADRFPELAKDLWFWIDMLAFLTVLDFLSYAGPRNPIPTVPWF